MFKKIFLLISILIYLFSMNFIKANVNLMNGTRCTIDLYPSVSAVESATSISMDSNQKISLNFPTEENYFIIQLAANLFFKFFYNTLNDKENYLIIFGKNFDKCACCLISATKKQDGILTSQNNEQLKINFSKHTQKQENKDYKEEKSSSSEIEEIKEIKFDSSDSCEEW